MKKKNIGSSFDSWLREEGIYDEVTATALNRVLARQVEAVAKRKQISKGEMMRRVPEPNESRGLSRALVKKGTQS